MHPSDDDWIVVDANAWLNGLVCHEDYGVVNDPSSPVMNRFIKENKEKLITPGGVRGEVQRNLGVTHNSKNKKKQSKNILKKLCKNAGLSESTRRELTIKTLNDFEIYRNAGHQGIRKEANKPRRARVDEIWRMFKLIFYKNREGYMEYYRDKERKMRGKNGNECRTPEGYDRHESWEWWYPPPGDIDIIAFADWCTESGLRIWVVSFDKDFGIFFTSITNGVFRGTPYVRRPICSVRLLADKDDIEDYLDGNDIGEEG